MYNGQDTTKQIELLNNLYKQEEQASIDGNSWLETAFYEDIASLVKSILTNIICSYGSGTIASIIGDTKYTQIDKAVNKALCFLFHAEEEFFHDFNVNAADIAKLIRQCYTAKETEKDGILVPDIN